MSLRRVGQIKEAVVATLINTLLKETVRRYYMIMVEQRLP